MKYLEFWEKFQAAEQAAEVFEIKTIGFQLYPMIRTRLLPTGPRAGAF